MYSLKFNVFTSLIVRLVNGSTKYEGRVEVYYNGQWGTVCDDGWDLNDAQVVCRQLGFGPAIAARNDKYYGQGSGQIWLDYLNCTGTELTIEYCSHSGWGIHDCYHEEGAGVVCATSNGNFVIMCACTYHGLFVPLVVRLVNGSTQYEGRVEVYYNGQWGTVCDDGWDLNDAQVVCRQLGFGPPIEARDNAYYGQGSGQIWLSNLTCITTELNIEDCLHGGWEIDDCSHTEDAGLKCTATMGTFESLDAIAVMT